MAASTSSKPELRVSETWDTCIENTIRKLAYGALGGVVLSVVLFRAPVARSAVVGLGAGVGVGMGYTDCKHEFDAIDRETASAQK